MSLPPPPYSTDRRRGFAAHLAPEALVEGHKVGEVSPPDDRLDPRGDARLARPCRLSLGVLGEALAVASASPGPRPSPAKMLTPPSSRGSSATGRPSSRTTRVPAHEAMSTHDRREIPVPGIARGLVCMDGSFPPAASPVAGCSIRLEPTSTERTRDRSRGRCRTWSRRTTSVRGPGTGWRTPPSCLPGRGGSRHQHAHGVGARGLGHGVESGLVHLDTTPTRCRACDRAERVRLQRVDGDRRLAEESGRPGAVRLLPVVVHLVRRHVLAGRERGARPRPARVLPLGLGRQVQARLPAELDALDPGDPLDGKVRALEPGRVRAHELLPVRLRDLVLRDQEPAQLDLVDRSLVDVPARLGLRAAHRELPAREEHEDEVRRVVK